MKRSLELDILEHIKDPDSLHYLIKEGFDSKLIYDPDIKSKVVWSMDYFEKYGKYPTLTIFNEEFPGMGREPDPAFETPYLLDKLKERFILNEQRTLVERLALTEEPKDFLDIMVQESYNLWKVAGKQNHIAASSNYQSFIAEFQEEAKNPKAGASFGFEPMDKLTGGGKGGHLSFIAARPKRFKTWMLLNAFVEQRRQGLIPIMFNLELSANEIMKRLACLVSGISYNNVVHGNMMRRDWETLSKGMEKFSNLGPAYILTPSYEDRTVDKMTMEVKKLGGQSVLIDQLNYIQSKNSKQAEHQSYRDIVHQMKASAVSMDIPWYCICQFNREAASLEEMAGADKAGLTRAIEETCDLFLGLHRTKDQASRGIVQLGVVEARHCPSERIFDVEVELTKATKFTMYED